MYFASFLKNLMLSWVSLKIMYGIYRSLFIPDFIMNTCVHTCSQYYMYEINIHAFNLCYLFLFLPWPVITTWFVYSCGFLYICIIIYNHTAIIWSFNLLPVFLLLLPLSSFLVFGHCLLYQVRSPFTALYLSNTSKSLAVVLIKQFSTLVHIRLMIASLK